MNSEIILRAATLADLSLLQHWDEQPHVISCDPDDDWNWEFELSREPNWRKQLIAELNGRPIGVVQIIDPAKEESHYWGNVGDNLRAIDIWIGEKTELGKGYGTQMMHKAIDICFSEDNVTVVLIDPLSSNKKAHRFYERLGFRFVEKRNFDESLCDVYRLDRKEPIERQGYKIH